MAYANTNLALANAHYNLAAVYKAQEKWEKAILELQTVLSLTEPASADFEKVQEELKEVEGKMPKREEIVTGEEEAGGQLQEPPVLPTPQVSPIQLPLEEAAPEFHRKPRLLLAPLPPSRCLKSERDTKDTNETRN